LTHFAANVQQKNENTKRKEKNRMLPRIALLCQILPRMVKNSYNRQDLVGYILPNVVFFVSLRQNIAHL
jgi:hypothetical protein